MLGATDVQQSTISLETPVCRIPARVVIELAIDDAGIYWVVTSSAIFLCTLRVIHYGVREGAPSTTGPIGRFKALALSLLLALWLA